MNDLEKFCQSWLESWTGNNPDLLISFYSDDVYYRDPARPNGLKGREELYSYFKKLLAKNPNWIWKPLEVIPTSIGFTLKWRAQISVGAKEVQVEGLDIVQVEDTKIIRNEVFFALSPLFLFFFSKTVIDFIICAISFFVKNK